MALSGHSPVKSRNMHIHLFCRIIDNYGDIAVCWRLARQLVHDFDQHVTLWVDQWPVAAYLTGQPLQDGQTLSGVTFRHWHTTSWPEPVPASVPASSALPALPDLPALPVGIVAGFGCDLPDALLYQMAEPGSAGNHHLWPRSWVNLEYFSAESWVDDYHGLTSPHPRLPLTAVFCYPGLSSQSGGLLLEQGGLIAPEQTAITEKHFWQTLIGRTLEADTLKVSLFSYERPDLPALITALQTCGRPVLCLVTAGAARKLTDSWLVEQQLPPLETGQSRQLGQLCLFALPFLSQSAYDQLLCHCDLNLVRGEDSLSRAMLAGRPWLWHIYPQAGQAHHVKLQALIARLQQVLSKWPALQQPLLAQALNQWCQALQDYGTPDQAALPADRLLSLLMQIDQLHLLAQHWRHHLLGLPSLAATVMQMLTNRVESPVSF